MEFFILIIACIIVGGIWYMKGIKDVMFKDFSPVHRYNKNRKNKKIDISLMPYRKREYLSQAEFGFYQVLRPIIDQHDCEICPKVGLKDIIELSKHDNHNYWFAKISQKHVDFLICDKNMNPVFAIELDDKSHEKEIVMKNDEFTNRLFKEVGIPLYRIKIGGYYNLEHTLFPRCHN